MRFHSLIFLLQYIYPPRQVTHIFATFHILNVVGSDYFPIIFKCFRKVWCVLLALEGKYIEVKIIKSGTSFATLTLNDVIVQETNHKLSLVK